MSCCRHTFWELLQTCLLAVILILPSNLICQLGPKIISFSNDLINNNSTWSIDQSQAKLMYFGNSDGLITYDGQHWGVLESGDRQVIRAVSIDFEGRIFSGAYNDFGVWERDSATLLSYTSLIDQIKNDISEQEEIWNILLWKDAVYFQSFTAIYKYNYDKVEILNPPSAIMFIHEVHDNLYFQAIGGGIYQLTEENSFNALPGTDFFHDKEVVFILPHGDSDLLIGTEQSGIYIYNGQEIFIWTSSMNEVFKHNELNKGILLSNGNYALGSILNGLYFLDDKGKLVHHISRIDGLQNNTVLSLCEDISGNLWAGLERGINLIELNSPLFYFDDWKGLLGTVFTAVIYNDNLYLGTNHGVYFCNWEDALSGRPLDFQKVDGIQGLVWQLAIFDGYLWCGHNEGTFLIEDNKASKISNVSGGWLTMTVPGKSNLLLQCTYSGLVVFKKNEYNKWEFSHQVKGFNESIKSMVWDASGSLWVANPIEGLHKLRLDNDLLSIEYLRRITSENGLVKDKFIDLFVHDDRVYIRSAEQWLYCDEQSDFLTSIDSFLSIPFQSGGFNIFLGDDFDWFQSFDDKLIYHTGEASYEFNLTLVPDFENILLLDSSHYLFCLNDGFAIFDKNNVSTIAEHLPPPVITKVGIIGDNPNVLDFLIIDSALYQQLSWDENNMIFHFAQAVYSKEPDFRFRLLGFEESWTDWSQQNFKEYTNLFQGTYTFEVESSLSEERTSFTFEILPHWSRSSFALFLYALATIGLILLIRRWQSNRLGSTKRTMVAEQERLLAEQELRTNNEKLQVDVLNKSKDLVNSTNSLVQKNEILLEIKDELSRIKRKSDYPLAGKEFQHLLHIINKNLTSEQDWELFEKNFNSVHESFFKQLQADFPELTPGDLKLAAYLRMNLSSKEVAQLFHISIRGVENKRYRLRKKLNLPNNENLASYVMKY